MFKIKKAQGLSMNVIIVAVLALLVLVVLSVVFTGRMGKTVQEVDKCVNAGGQCVLADLVESNEACNGQYERVRTDLFCDDTGTRVCCAGLTS